MKYVLLVAVAAAAFPCAASSGSLPGVPIGDWASGIVADLHFQGGVLLRSDYRARGDKYVAYQSAYYRELHEPMLRNAGTRPNRAGAALQRMAGMIVRAEEYVKSTEEGIFRTLDPDGSGSVGESDAISILSGLGMRADLDGNGRLDIGERRLAEAALAKGADLSNPAVKRSMLLAFAAYGDLDDASAQPPLLQHQPGLEDSDDASPRK